MKITKSYLKQIIKEEVDKVKEGRYGRYGGGYGRSRARESNTDTARDSLESAIEQFGAKVYEERKAKLESEGRKIVNIEKFMSYLEQDKESWLKAYDREFGAGYGDEDMEDRHLSPGQRMPQMSERLRAVALMARADIPNWSVMNNMYEPNY